ncbi:S66 peptidase family protein [Adhaeribacter pallidiroseus]|uniref:Muramoyltetrapeptide carboxypeptidase n=1 Tax=Adhaeribacter pallidiroseus TaxID=2072847 RepID=A0A369QLM2_9BACT|nr:LD-carboxypeptidase [Adhaeribacter pallidiroseus]RDC65250.1 Muramoyltetrapeptide carboxypeptidase [Adhaeribacter pallidiroseus]
MIFPPRLQPGDKIAICALARKITLVEIQSAVDILTSWGLEVVIGESLAGDFHQFAGNDALRLRDLQTMLDNPEIKAIISARGGYGTTRLLDQLNFEKFKKSPKWLIGFSDITALLCHVLGMGYAGIHSIMPSLFSRSGSEAAIESLRKVLFGEPITYQTSAHAFNRLGAAQGILFGGNISLLNTIIGTASDIDYTGKILFVEEIDEYLYNLDRMLVQLKRSGKLSCLTGLIVGHMTDMRDNPVPFGKTAYEIIQEHTAAYSYPVCYDFPTGHEPHNLALICGAQVRLEVSGTGSFLEYVPE